MYVALYRGRKKKSRTLLFNDTDRRYRQITIATVSIVKRKKCAFSELTFYQKGRKIVRANLPFHAKYKYVTYNW